MARLMGVASLCREGSASDGPRGPHLQRGGPGGNRDGYRVVNGELDRWLARPLCHGGGSRRLDRWLFLLAAERVTLTFFQRRSKSPAARAPCPVSAFEEGAARCCAAGRPPGCRLLS